MDDGYFDLGRRAFPSVPQADRYFPAAAIEDARQTLTRCLQRGEGPGLVVGPTGTGKSLLCRVLAAQVSDSLPVAVLAGGRLGNRRALLQAILYELGRPYRDMDEGETRLALVDHLTTGEDRPVGIVLLIDEAHTLPLRTLEEVRMLTNLVHDGRPLVRLVLVGGAALEERFASPKLDSFSQRLAARCYLEPFNGAETLDYIRAAVNSAGGDGEEIFPDETCRRVYQATDGVPRLVNQVCDHALLSAYVARRGQITPADVEEAWADLQQLPTPWNGEPDDDGVAGNVIEFGGLDDSANQTGEAGLEDSASPALRISPGPDESDLAGEPAAQLERIENLLVDADEDFQPAGSITREVELTFDEPGHPFQEEFQQEEVVADRYTGGARTTTAEPSRTGRPGHPEVAAELPPNEPAPASWHEAGGKIPPDASHPTLGEPRDGGVEPACPIVAVRQNQYGRLFATLRRG